MTSPVLLRPADVGGAHAFQALALDGVIVPLRDGVARLAATADTTRLRAAALADVVPHRVVVAGRSALWVHCGGDAPRVLEVYYRSHAHRPRGRPDLRVRQATLLARDVTDVHGLTVTSPARTAADLVGELPVAEAEAAVRTLVTVGLDPREVHDLLRTRLRWAGREAVLALVDAAAGAA